MGLFQLGDFVLHSGDKVKWKIECDALCDDDWRCAAEMIAELVPFSAVHGVPTGGNKLAELLRGKIRPNDNGPVLIVDDVYTTGASIRAVRDKLARASHGSGQRHIGAVLFARRPIKWDDRWVKAVFQCWS